MTERTSFYRKLAYLGIIVVLAFPIVWLSVPATSTRVAARENTEKLTPFPSKVAPRGAGLPGQTRIVSNKLRPRSQMGMGCSRIRRRSYVPAEQSA